MYLFEMSPNLAEYWYLMETIRARVRFELRQPDYCLGDWVIALIASVTALK